MIRANIEKLADYIEGLGDAPLRVFGMDLPPHRNYFWMPDYCTPIENMEDQRCGTAACIAGCVALMNQRKDIYMDIKSTAKTNIAIVDYAREFLGLHVSVAAELFNPQRIEAKKQIYNTSDVMKKHAVFVLRCMEETEIVDAQAVRDFWARAFDELGE